MGRTRLTRLAAVACIVAWSFGASARESSSGPLTFDLRDSADRRHTEKEWSGARAIVLFFITPDCPVSQGYVPEMNRIRADFAARGILVYGVQSDLAAADTEVRRHVEEFAYAFPVLLDRRHELVEHVDAEITPEAVVLTPSGEVLYQGRIDDRIPAIGVRRPRATRHELRDALDAVLSGGTVARTGPPAVGCFIVRRT